MTKYMIVVPISGSAETRNPVTKYFGFVVGDLTEHKQTAYITEDVQFLKEILKTRKKEAPEVYKQAFIAENVEIPPCD